MQVFKFGGASVKDADGIKNITSIIQKYPSTNLLIVISAMGKITNKLEELTWAYVKGSDSAHEIFEEIKN
ncbi:MAG: aspartate kinase, partial [Flavobacterium sp.]